MKNLNVAHISIKQSILSSLINGETNEDPKYCNIKASLINNAMVFPVPEVFDLKQFAEDFKKFLADDLKIKTESETFGDDIFSLPFSPIGLGLMKKTIIFTMFDFHLYMNIIPVKEIENANYSENKISEFLSSGKNEQIYTFTENYILNLYPEDIRKTVKGFNRYYYTQNPGIAAILAKHLEDGEEIMAKLDIYKIEQSKSNAQTSEADQSFYLLTTFGAYLFVTDKNQQEKYIETLSAEKLKVTSRIGRDDVQCGVTKWVTNRDNDFLFDEIQDLNNLEQNEKIKKFAIANFNHAEKNEDKVNAAKWLETFAKVTNCPFNNFAAKVLKFSSQISEDNIDETTAKELMDSANSLFSVTNFEKRIKEFLSDFNFSAKEIITLIYVISRAKNRLSDINSFKETMLMLKEKYFKLDDDNNNRAFIEISIAKKLNILGDKTSSMKLAKDALDIISDQTTVKLRPMYDTTPEMPYNGAALYVAAIEELSKASESEKDKQKYAQLLAIEKPLIKKNITNLQKVTTDEDLKKRISNLEGLYSAQNFNNFTYESEYTFKTKYSKLSTKLFTESTQRGKAYRDLNDWIAKIQPDKTLSTIKEHAQKVTEENYSQLNSLVETCRDFFEMPEVEVYVIFNRNQGVISNDDGETKYIILDGELLDTDSANYMNLSEMIFVLGKEFASLKTGISKLSSHGQWRNFANVGIISTDIIKQFVQNPEFLKNDARNYNKLMKFSELLTENTGYYNFDIEDTNSAAKMLKQTMKAIEYKGTPKIENLSEKEYWALSLLTTIITDRIGLVMNQNIVYAVKGIIDNDKYINGGIEFCKDNSVIELANSKTADQKPSNYDFSMRLNALIGFYLSDNYKELCKEMQKN